ncbi:apolipoprotein N-acyltransferase [Pseudomonas sp. WN033]|nr:apolipoprotein N-acyltransferase [Pseudomonas sp. WN033]
MSSLEPTPGPVFELSRPVLRRRGVVWRFLLSGLSAVLLFLPWLYPQLFWLAWLGWIPLLWALDDSRPGLALLLGWFAGTLYFAGTCYWMIDFAINLKGLSWLSSMGLAMLFWLYSGLLLGLAGLLYRYLSQQLPAWDVLSFPLAFVSLTVLYPALFETNFAETQTEFLLGLQGVAVFGAKGMDLAMLLFAVLVYRLWRPLPQYARLATRLQIGGWSLLAAWMLYGVLSLDLWDQRVEGWETRRIGLVQPNDPPSIEIPPPAPGFSREFPEEMAATARLQQAGAEWVVWPEARYKGWFELYSVREAWARQLSEWQLPLIFHDVERRWVNSRQVSFNSMVLLGADGEQQGFYRKMLRMPFGEYLPEFFQLPGLRHLSEFFLGEFLRPLRAGQSHSVFELDGMRIVPKICYEAAFPRFNAQAVGADGAGKLLLFVSQDNWFGETNQPFQHRAMSIVRAVENRVPMVHLINNGPSVAASPQGRVVAGTEAFTRAELLVDLPFSPVSGGSLFSRYPWLTESFLLAGLALLLLAAGLRRYRYGPCEASASN